MTDYTELIEALRHLSTGRCDDLHGCEPCAIYETCLTRCVLDAAAAIEALQAAWIKSETDATNLTGRLAQAEADIERLKESNEELREKQTYIDHYGTKWMTSAKDVPTAAYEHGYMDGRDEAMAKMEVQDA